MIQDCYLGHGLFRQEKKAGGLKRGVLRMNMRIKFLSIMC